MLHDEFATRKAGSLLAGDADKKWEKEIVVS